MIVERDRMVDDATNEEQKPPEVKTEKYLDNSANVSAAVGGTSQNIQLGVIKVHEHEKKQ